MSTWFGNGQGVDVSLIPSGGLLTNTSQYLLVGMPDTTTAADKTVYLTDAGAVNNNTATARHAIGINMSRELSAGSEVCDVRVLGLAKAKCADSVAAGAPIMAYEGVSTTTFAGHIVQANNGISLAAATASITTHRRILGFALHAGPTNSVIEVVLIPQLYDQSFIIE